MTSLPSTISQLRLSLTREPARWFRPLLVVSILALSVLLPRLVSGRDVWLLLALPLGVAGLLLLLRWPPLAIVLLIPAGLLVPLEISTGSNTRINVTILMLALLSGLWVLQLITGRRQAILASPSTMTPLLGFLLVAILAFVAGQLPWFPLARQAAPLTAQVGGLLVFILSAAAFLLVANWVRDLRWLQWLTWIFVGLGSLYILLRFLPGLDRVAGRLFVRTSTATAAMFWTWLVALAFSQALVNRRLQLRWRLLLIGLVLMTFYVAYFEGGAWKSGYLPPLVAVMTIVALRSWRAALALVLVSAVPTIALLSQAVATDQYSYSTRIDAWLIMLEIIRVNPILGFGPANYYWYTPLFPIRGYSVVFNSHNQYVDIVAQTGLLGLLFFLWFAFEVARTGWRLREKVPEGFAKAYVYGALGGLAATLAAGMLVDWFLPFVYNIGLKGMRASILPWLFLGGLVALGQIYRHPVPSQQ